MKLDVWLPDSGQLKMAQMMHILSMGWDILWAWFWARFRVLSGPSPVIHPDARAQRVGAPAGSP